MAEQPTDLDGLSAELWRLRDSESHEIRKLLDRADELLKRAERAEARLRAVVGTLKDTREWLISGPPERRRRRPMDVVNQIDRALAAAAAEEETHEH